MHAAARVQSWAEASSRTKCGASAARRGKAARGFRYDPAKPRRARLQGYGEPGLFVTLVTGVAMAFLTAGLFTNLFA
ncbi:hypothetical protein ACFXAW_00095 [Streptomyces sp. NPDC059445]|uniref:hypothetical protein n=1 Tax=Streptomyces sp. NPDC059445 TaxID=3346832 RepID=UPI0036CC71DA